MTSTTSSQAALAERAHTVWLALRAAADALSDEQLEQPNTIGSWSGRDVLVHIATWEAAATEAIGNLDAGRPLDPIFTNEAEWDAWNEEQLAPYRGLSLADAKHYIEQTHQALLDAIRSSPNVYPQIVLSSYLYHLDDLLTLAWR
jgi:hypothetical protein